jgi:hypothetical protein
LFNESCLSWSGCSDGAWQGCESGNENGACGGWESDASAAWEIFDEDHLLHHQT